MRFRNVVLMVLAVACGPALADVTVGISVSATGPAASLGIPEKNAVALLPTTIGGEKVKYVVLDDATDTTQAAKNARKLIGEDNADVIIGSSNVPGCLAIAEVANETKTPQIALGPVDLPAEKNAWVFRTPQHNSLMASALVEHMRDNGVKTLGFIGYADPYGEGWLREITKATDGAGIKLTAVERYNRTDTSVTGQALKVLTAKPDAVLIVGSGTPAALPHTTLIERGYKGQIYQTHGAASREFLRVGGRALEDAILPLGPVVVASQLPDGHPSKKIAIEFTQRYEERYGVGTFSSFAAHLYDAFKLIERAVPVAARKARPGTPEFRQALHDAIESNGEVVATHGVFNMSPTDHFGLDARARVLARVHSGDWQLLPGKQK